MQDNFIPQYGNLSVEDTLALQRDGSTIGPILEFDLTVRATYTTDKQIQIIQKI